MARLRITWVRSQIGCARDQRRTIRALGLRRLNHSVEHEDTPTIRGMVHKVRHLVAVEPSSSMGEVLRQQASECAIENVSLVESTWEKAEVEAADLVLCVHVLYVVPEIEAFVRKLEAHARERVLVVLYRAPPQSQTYPLWKKIHREERLGLPSLPEFQEVLSQLGIDAQLDMLPALPPRGFDDHQQALEQLSRRLYLAAGTPQMASLEAMLPDLLEQVDGTWIIRGTEPLQPGLIRWRPEGST